MAATKKPKSDKKTMDVAHPETTVPDETSRPIIVSNRTIIQDPMVAPDQTMNSDFREPTTSPVVPTRLQKTIKPSAIKKTEDADNAAPPPSENVARQGKSVKPITIVGPAETEAQNMKAPDVSSSAKKDLDKDAPTEVTAPEEDTPPAPTEDSSKKPTPESEMVDKSSTVAPKPTPAAEKKEESAETDSSAKSDDESDHESDDEADDKATDEPDQASKDAAEEAKAAEQEEHLKELIDEKTYFVPIKHASGKGGSAILFLLVVIAAAATVAYMVTQTSAS